MVPTLPPSLNFQTALAHPLLALRQVVIHPSGRDVDEIDVASLTLEHSVLACPIETEPDVCSELVHALGGFLYRSEVGISTLGYLVPLMSRERVRGDGVPDLAPEGGLVRKRELHADSAVRHVG